MVKEEIKIKVSTVDTVGQKFWNSVLVLTSENSITFEPGLLIYSGVPKIMLIANTQFTDGREVFNTEDERYQKYLMVKKYLKSMVQEFCDGNDNEYDEGTVMEFRYEGEEKIDDDLYGEEEVNKFITVRDEIKRRNGWDEVIGKIEYEFRVSGEDIVCKWIEPKWDNI